MRKIMSRLLVSFFISSFVVGNVLGLTADEQRLIDEAKSLNISNTNDYDSYDQYVEKINEELEVKQGDLVTQH